VNGSTKPSGDIVSTNNTRRTIPRLIA